MFKHRRANAQIKHAEEFIKAQRYGDALDALDAATTIDPESTAAWFAKGGVLFKLESYDEALEAFDRVLQLDGHNVDAWLAKGGTLLAEKHYEQAMAIGRHVLTLDPNNEQAAELIEHARKRQARHDGIWDFIRSAVIEVLVSGLFS